MKLKALYLTEDAIPEGFKDLYEKTEAGWVLVGIEDTDFKRKLGEFRENNISQAKAIDKAKKELKALKEQWKDVDPEKVKQAEAMLAKIEEDEEKTLIREGKLDELVSRRTGTMRTDFAKQLKAKDTALGERDKEVGNLRSSLGTLLIEQEVQLALGEAGVKTRTSALADVIARARSAWKITEEGKSIAVDAEGKQRYGKDGDAMTMREFAGEMVENAPHLFENAEGGGGSGSRTGTKPTKIDLDDPEALGRAAEDIASGKIKVT